MSKTSVQLHEETQFKLHDGETFTAEVGDWITIDTNSIIDARTPDAPADQCTVWGGQAVHAKTGAVSTWPSKFLKSTMEATNPHETSAADKEYRLVQMNRVQPDEMNSIPVKFGQGVDSTNWINLTPAEFEQIKAILTK